MKDRQRKKDQIQAVIDMGTRTPGLVWGNLPLLREEAMLTLPLTNHMPLGITGLNSRGLSILICKM